MDTFEYKVIKRGDGGDATQALFCQGHKKVEVALNKLGEEGWELITIKKENTGAEDLFYFKRKSNTQ